MKKIAFKMKLKKGAEAEYKRRHDEIWPELSALLSSKGISNYSIFLDEPTGELLAVMELNSLSTFHELPAHALMKEWWRYMSDIMETNPDNSPVTIPLKEVFFMA